MKVNGVIKKVYTREHKGNTYYSICVDVDGDETWFSCGRDKPKQSEGDTVSFVGEKDGKYWKVDVSEIKKESTGSGAKAVGGGGWNDPERQKSIVAQSCIKMAIDWLSLALESESLVLATPAAKAPKKYEALELVFAEKAREFYGIATNPDGFFDVEAAEDDDDDFSPIPD